MSLSSNEIRKLKSIVRRRELKCKNLLLEPAHLVEILANGLELTPGIAIPENAHEPLAKLMWLIYHHLRMARNEEIDLPARRNALKIAKNLLKSIDAAQEKKSQQISRNQAIQVLHNTGNGEGKERSSRTRTTTNNDKPSTELLRSASLWRKSSSKVGSQLPDSIMISTKVSGILLSTEQDWTSQQQDSAGEHSLSRNTPAAAITITTERSVEPQRKIQRSVLVQRTSSGSNGANSGAFSLAKYCASKDQFANFESTGAGTSTQQTRNVQYPPREPPPYTERSASVILANEEMKGRNSSEDPKANKSRGYVLHEHNGMDASAKLLSQKRDAEERKRRRVSMEFQDHAAGKTSEIAEQKEAEERARLQQAKKEAEERAHEEAAARKDEEKRKATLAAELAEAQQRKKREETLRKEQEQKAAVEAALRRAEEDRSRREEEERQRDLERKKAEIAAKQKRKIDEKNEVISAVLRSGVEACRIRGLCVTFPADNKPTKSLAIDSRSEVTVRFTPEAITREQADSISTRLETWDPYWKTVAWVATGVTSIAKGVSNNRQQFSAFLAKFRLKSSDIKGMKATDWGRESALGGISDGQKRLLLRMLPYPSATKKRADCHIFPKGCFVVVNSSAVHCVQRKQQGHDRNYWLGQCEPLDLTPHIVTPTGGNEVRLLSFDDQQYYFCIALCQYVSPSSLYKTLLAGPKPLWDPLLAKLSRGESIAKAKAFTRHDTVTLDEDNDPNSDDVGKFVFTLTCPFSKLIMTKPVRGKKCQHYQCFDLRNYLDCNAIVTGQRWRCLVCENHCSYGDLELCGFTEDLIQEFQKDLAPTSRDRIEFCSNGSYRLLEAKKQRYKNNKKRSAPDSNPSGPSIRQKPTPKNDSEPVIILLD